MSLKKVCLRSFSLIAIILLFVPNYFVKCRRTLLKLNFKGPYPGSEGEIKFCRCLFTSSIKHEIRHFHVVVVQKRERNVQKSVMHVQSCCFAYKTYCFLTSRGCPHRWILKSLLLGSISQYYQKMPLTFVTKENLQIGKELLDCLIGCPVSIALSCGN